MPPSLFYPSPRTPRGRMRASPKCNPPSNGHFLRIPSSLTKHSPGFLRKLHLVPPTKPPLFSFGLVADIQYALRDTQIKTCKNGPHGKLDRRMGWAESLGKVSEAVSTWSQSTESSAVDFILSLGDIIEGNESYMQHLSERELKAVLSALSRSNIPVKHILGNHCRRLSKPRLLSLLGLESSYYSFQPAPGWRFICLDTTELCGTAIDSNMQELAYISEAIKFYRRPHHKFHGMVSPAQLNWLTATLRDAARENEHVIIATHYPLKGARDTHLALNSEKILAAIESSEANVVAVLAGHDHSGATVLPNTANNATNTAFITMPAMLESPALSNAFATVSAFEDGTLEITGYGMVPSHRIRPSHNNSSNRNGNGCSSGRRRNH